MEKLITHEFGVPKVSQALAELLNYVKSKHKSLRHSIHYVRTKEGLLVVTNGRQLLEISLPEGFEIKAGFYHLTGEGFLLEADNAENYPDWRELYLKQVKQIARSGQYFDIADGDSQQGIALAIKTIGEAGYLLNFSMLYSTLNRLARCGCSHIELFKKPEDSEKTSAILITSESHGLKFKYLQMPLLQQ